MTASPSEPPRYSPPPRVVAVSGVVFSTVYIVSLVLIRLSVPIDPTERGEWLADPTSRHYIGFALNLIPLSGIAFLWFMGVLRNRIGLLEDRFFATVFLGSGLLFVAMLFAAAAVSQGIHFIAIDDQSPVCSESYRMARRTAYALLNVFGMKMAAVFIFMTSTIGLRTGVLARWVSFVGYAIGLVLLLSITDFVPIALLFPFWVLLLSIWILVVDYKKDDVRNDGLVYPRSTN